MKCLIKWLFRLALLLVILLVVLVLAKDAILKAAVEQQLRARTGMDAKIRRLSLGLLSPVVTIEDFKLYNSAEFGGTVFLDVPELHLEYDRPALADRRLHLKLMRLHLAELNVVRNEAGRTNLVSVMQQAAGPQPRSRTGKREPDLEFAGIDVLNLSLGKARYLDLKEPSRSRELILDLRDRVIKNVRTESDMYGVLLLIWLRNGGSFQGVPMLSPPEVLSLPASPKTQSLSQPVSAPGVSPKR